MNNTDLEKLYSRIDGHISLVGAFYNNNSYVKIIKGCRLKPYSIFTKDFKTRTTLEKYWVDEFGNSVLFDKVPKILINDSQLDYRTKISSDLFFGTSLSTTAENSKAVFIAGGVFLDTDFYFILFYGQDEYLRAFTFNKSWARVSPLMLGINSLQEIYKYIEHTNRIIEIDKGRLDIILPFEVEAAIISPLPIKQSIPPSFKRNIITFYKGE